MNPQSFRLRRWVRAGPCESGSDGVANGNQRRNGSHHHDELGDSAFVVVPKQVNALDLSLANTAREAEYLAVTFPNLPLISELGNEYVTDHLQQRADALAAFVWRKHAGLRNCTSGASAA